MAKVLVATKGMPRDEWLAWRRRGIGGSDAPAVAGLDPESIPWSTVDGIKNQIYVAGPISLLRLRRRNGPDVICIVDTEDLQRIADADLRWYAHWDPKGQRYYVAANKYVGGGRRNPRYRRFLLARMLVDAPPHFEVDHINRNSLDNRKSNLRIVSHAENCRNKGVYRNNRSGFTGVHWSAKRKMWAASIKVAGCQRWIGYFKDPREAAMAVLRARAGLGDLT